MRRDGVYDSLTGKVAPGLVLRARAWHIETGFHDPVVRAEHIRTNRSYPRMRYKVNETADSLRMDFDVKSIRPPVQDTTGLLLRFVEQSVDVASQLCNPFPAEGAFAAEHAVAVESAKNCRRFELWRFLDRF